MQKGCFEECHYPSILTSSHCCPHLPQAQWVDVAHRDRHIQRCHHCQLIDLITKVHANKQVLMIGNQKKQPTLCLASQRQ